MAGEEGEEEEVVEEEAARPSIGCPDTRFHQVGEVAR